jgi:hypothetical protein
MTVLADEIQDTYSVVEGGGDGVNKKRGELAFTAIRLLTSVA